MSCDTTRRARQDSNRRHTVEDVLYLMVLTCINAVRVGHRGSERAIAVLDVGLCVVPVAGVDAQECVDGELVERNRAALFPPPSERATPKKWC